MCIRRVMPGWCRRLVSPVLVWTLIALVALAAGEGAVSRPAVAGMGPDSAQAAVSDVRWEPLLKRLERDGYGEDVLRRVFAHPELRFTAGPMVRKLRALYRRKYVPSKKKSAPVSPIYPNVLAKDRLAKARVFLREHLALLKQVRRTYGVEPEIAVALLSVETDVGHFLGRETAVRTLASMAATTPQDMEHGLRDLHPTRGQQGWIKKRLADKADWAYKELKALLDHANRDGHDLSAMPGSVYGAVGLCQFMPSSVLRFGVDGDRDGRVDLFEPEDAVHSLANYLRGNGWKPGLGPRGKKKYLLRYNHSRRYAASVLAVADALRAR